MASLMIDHNAYLVIDVGGTYLKSAILNKEGGVFEGSALMTKSFSEGSKEEILEALKHTILSGLAFITFKKVLLMGIGMTFPGPFDYNKGEPLMDHKFKNIYGVGLREFIRSIPGVFQQVPIQFKHDANAVMAGELWKGNAQGYENAAVVTLGTGLGFAFSHNKIVQCNSLGGPLITIFKLPYKQGILEDYTAKRGFIKIYREISGNLSPDIEVSEIGKGADAGDFACIQTIREIGKILAESLKPILIEKNIQCLLFAGQISRSFCHMEEVLKLGLQEVECLRKISMVRSIDNSALLGVLQTIIK